MVWLTEALLVAMALIWGVNYSVVKFGTTLIDPLAYNGVRVTAAAVILTAIVLLTRAPLPNVKTTGALLALGFLGNGIYQFFFVEGIARTRATDTALVVATSPAFIAIIGRLRGIERLSPRGVAGIMLSIAGIGLVVAGTPNGGSRSATVVGDALILCGALSWAAYSVLLKPYTERVPGLQLSALTMIGGAVPLLIVAWPAVSHTAWAALPPLGWGAIGYSAVLALVVAYFFWYRGVREVGPTKSSMYSNLQPPIAMLVAWVMLGEAPNLWQSIGALCVMGSLVIIR